MMTQPAFIASGTDFAMLYTALRDDTPQHILDNIRLGELTDIPSEYLDDLSPYEVTAMLSTSSMGKRVVATTDTERSGIEITRRDDAHLVVNISHTLTLPLSDGTIIITIELRHKQTGTIIKAEERAIPIKRLRDIPL